MNTQPPPLGFNFRISFVVTESVEKTGTPLTWVNKFIEFGSYCPWYQISLSKQEEVYCDYLVNDCIISITLTNWYLFPLP